MIFYIHVENNKICDIDFEKNGINETQIEANNIDEFYEKIKKYTSIDEETEEKISSAFENEGEKHSVETYNIKHWVSNRSFGELIDMYENGEIIKPDMQRAFVWDSHKCSRLIESIILGLPIPPLFLMEVGNNEYELIDGLQRLTTVTNYVNERPWVEKQFGRRELPSKLSGNISEELKGKSFSKLPEKYQRTIKRSTIPLIEFRQVGPENLSSKYLIFERINTGSEKLNEMQIRKSLASGQLISDIYQFADSCDDLKQLFSVHMIKKDAHVEAALRVFVMGEIVYRNLRIKHPGINNILNDYCEDNRTQKIDKKFFEKFTSALKFFYEVFEEKKCMFRRVDIHGQEYEFIGNMNISILEAMMAVAIENNISLDNCDSMKTRKKYQSELGKVIDNSIKGKEDNPFSTSTGSMESIKKRFEICEKIMGKNE